MKTVRNSLLSLCLIFLLSGKAQTISSLQINPGIPNISNTVFVIATEQFPYSGCARTAWGVNANTSTIHVHSEHNMGMLTAICNTIDTIPLGQLAAGTYTLIFYLLNDQNAQLWDSDTIQFTVTGPVGKKEIDLNHDFNVFPNPGNGLYYLPDKYQGLEITFKIYNTLGQEVNVGQGIRTKELIDLSGEPDGLYLLKLTTPVSEKWIRLIKKVCN